MSDLLAYAILGGAAYGIYLYETGNLPSFLVNTTVGVVEGAISEVGHIGQELGSDLAINFIESLGIHISECKKGIIKALPENVLSLPGTRKRVTLAKWKCEVSRYRSLLLDANVGVTELTANKDGSQLIAAYDHHPEYDRMMEPGGFDRVYLGDSGLMVAKDVKFRDLTAPTLELNLPSTLFWLYDRNPKKYEKFRKKGLLPRLPYRRP